MSWRELKTFIRQAPPDSAYVRAVRVAHGDDPDRTLATEIARAAANAAITANYQRAGKRTPPHALIPEPGKAGKAKSKAQANGAKPGTWQDLDKLFDPSGR